MKSILNKRVSFTVFELLPYLKSLSKKEINERISEHIFKELDSAEIFDVSTGFINPIDITAPACTEQFDNFLVFSVRTDEYSFTAGQKKPFLERREQEYLRNNNLNHINPFAKKELNEEVHKYLKQRNLPKPSFVEFFIDLLEDKIVIMSTSAKILSRVIGLIEKAFMCSPEVISLKKKLYEKSNVVEFLKEQKDYMILGEKFEIIGTKGTVKTNSFISAEKVLELEESGLLTGAEIMLKHGEDDYFVYLNDSFQMKSVKMPPLLISDTGLKEADRMSKIMIFWKMMNDLIDKHISEKS